MDTLKNEFDEIVRLCEERVEEYGEHASYFMEPATEEEILEWERETGIQIPEDYKEWLKLTGTCQMCSTIASLIFPQTKQPDFLPDDYVLIGYVVGDGEVLCFSKSTGKYITYFEDEVDEEYEDFASFLKGIKKDIKGELPEINLTDDKIARMMENSDETKNKNKIIEWVIIVIVVIVLFVISDKVSDALDMNRRSVKCLILAIAAFLYWIFDTIRNKK